MRVEFKNNSKWRELLEIYENKRIARFPKNTEQGFRDAVYFLEGAESIQDIRKVRAYNFEKYKVGKYKGKFSIRCDIQFRLIFDIETNPNVIIILEEVTDPH